MIFGAVVKITTAGDVDQPIFAALDTGTSLIAIPAGAKNTRETEGGGVLASKGRGFRGVVWVLALGRRLEAGERDMDRKDRSWACGARFTLCVESGLCVVKGSQNNIPHVC